MAFFRRSTHNSQESQPDTDASSAQERGVSASEAADSVDAARPGWFARIRQGLNKTTEILNTDIRDLFKKEGELLDDEFLDRIFSVLIRTDMGAGPAREIRDEIAQTHRARVVKMDDILATIRQKLETLTDQQAAPIRMATEGPTIIMVVGVNGSGKTTTIAKLAAMFRQQARTVVLGAGDTFRAAAVEQLKIWADRVGAEIVTGASNADPASVAHRAVSRAIEAQADVCILDTAGRLQTQTHLMDQLSKIRRVVVKLIPDAPHETLLVLDATAGQNGISQARGFSEAAECTGIVLSKLDGTAKGGVVIPIRQQFNLPVKFIGVGEKPADLVVFDSKRFVEALFAGLE